MFQQNNKEEEIVRLSEKEIQTYKKKIAKKQNDPDNLEIKDLKINEIIPQVYNNVIITIFEGYHTLFLPDGMDKHKFKTFKKSPGGIFSKDVLNFSRGKKQGQYLLLSVEGQRKIIRLVENDEISMFKHLKLIKGILKDTPYMILRELEENDNLTNSLRYIKENSEHEEIDEVISITPQISSSVDDDCDSPISSVSLFDE